MALKHGKWLMTMMAVPVCLALQGCFTGIEGTKKIALSKQDKTMLAPTAEEQFLLEVKADTLKNWLPGKLFYVADGRISILIEPNDNPALERGDVLSFNSTDYKKSPDGSMSTILVFQYGDHSYRVPLDKNSLEASNTTSIDVPMLIDISMIEAVKDKMVGKTLWTRSSLWTDKEGNYVGGKKYVPVTVTAVKPGNQMFPVDVYFSTADGREVMMPMNFGNSGNESRSFAREFSLTDPRKEYPHISNEVWKAIQSETVIKGMTKDECRLALGNPSDVNSGHDYSTAMEIWYYPNGTYLQFADGILVNFR